VDRKWRMDIYEMQEIGNLLFKRFTCIIQALSTIWKSLGAGAGGTFSFGDLGLGTTYVCDTTYLLFWHRTAQDRAG